MTQFSKLRPYLFPFTPIEIEEEPRTGDPLESEWHITIAGEWHDKVQDLRSLLAVVQWLTSRYGDDWFYEVSRPNPGWPGWKRISRVDLVRFADGAGNG